MNGNITGYFEERNLGAIRELLQRGGFQLSGGPETILIATRDDCKVHLYKTRKALLQGHGSETIANSLIARKLLRLSTSNKSNRTSTNASLTNLILPRIGSDESGKGDYFGPLVTAAVWIDDKTQALFEREGVRDSKTVSDGEIRGLAALISRLTVAIPVPIGPEKYNELFTKMGTVNKILGWAHARAIENVLEVKSATLAVADQFGDESYIRKALLEKGKKLELRQMPKAEADTAVAAASIIARDEFIRRLENMSRDIGIRLPKGASQQVIDAAIEVVKHRGFQELWRLAKVHFKTTEQVEAAI